MSEIVISRALDVERVTGLALHGEESRQSVMKALLMLRGSFTAREAHSGPVYDSEGRQWSENLLRLERMVRVARTPEEAHEALLVVLRELEPLTGIPKREECFV